MALEAVLTKIDVERLDAAQRCLGLRVLHRHLGWLRRAQGREQSFSLIQAGIKEYSCSTQFRKNLISKSTLKKCLDH